MNVFEDLIIELKEENLLENTVIDDQREMSADDFALDITDMPDRAPTFTSEDRIEVETANERVATEEPATEPVQAAAPIVETAALPEQTQPQDRPQNQRQRNNKEFFKKRAINEVSSLQMVEHVLTGVEREYMKMMPKIYDDFKAKKALNTFLQISDTVNSEGHAEAEFELLSETEAWCSALAERDKNVPVSSLRQYCDNSKPALSSQAILAIARFYRNLPYSEAVRAKFDFVVTRLFSRANENDKRVCLFNREETLNHIKTLYAEWSSIPLYSAEDDDSSVVLGALSFEDLAVEAENASSFDQLIKTDFFGRLRTFKESLNETFFAPIVTAAAIEANVRIGNAYIALIARERQRMDADSIQTRYASLDSQRVSDATAQTLDFSDILRSSPAPLNEEFVAAPTHVQEQFEEEPEIEETVDAEPPVKKAPSEFLQRIRANMFSVNRWVIVFTVLMLAGTGGLVLWSNYLSEIPVKTDGVADVTFENPQVQEYVEKAKISNSMLYVQLKKTWAVLPKEKREDVLAKMYQAGADKGYREVNLISVEGKMIGYASATRLDIVMP
jgi:hypothetical protein